MHFSQLAGKADRYLEASTGTGPVFDDLMVVRRQAISEVEASIYHPVMCLILQGGKSTAIGDQTIDLQAGDALLVSHDLPVVSRITKASAQAPYLAVILSLDMALIRSLYEQVIDLPLAETVARSLSSGPAEQAWLKPLARYMDLMDDPLDVEVLGTPIRREIHYRLLRSPIGGMLRKLLVADSHASRIAKSIKKLRTDFRSPIPVANLAKSAGMSVSSFHEHFRSVTGTTPLQYQKDLRLIEAKALMANHSHAVSEAAFAVGYESPTHFSRDYSRKFGAPPSRDALDRDVTV